MKYETHLGLMKVRELLKRYSVIVYTGNALDEIVMMDMELTDLFEGRVIEQEEFKELKIVLRQAYKEAGGEES
ncbi:MAG: YqgQ family protein [Tumebacillaceae bacterium]